MGIGCGISIFNDYSLSAGNFISSYRTNDYSLMLQWCIPREMRCHQHQSIIASQDMQSHMRDKSISNNRHIGSQSTKWTYTKPPLFRPHLLVLGRMGLTTYVLSGAGYSAFNISAKVQIDYRLRYAHTCTRAAHSKLPVDPCATRSL
jgi:hypothetical protein